MTDRDQLDRIIDGLGYYYWNTVRLTEKNDDIQPKRDKLAISLALGFAGLDWIKKTSGGMIEQRKMLSRLQGARLTRLFMAIRGMSNE